MTPRTGRKAVLALLVASVTGCMSMAAAGSGSETSGGEGAPPGGSEAVGSLRQEEITVEISLGPVLVRLTPLDPEILRLTAPDTRRRLESLPTGRDGTSFLLSVFTEEPGGADFEPRGLSLENRGRVYRPVNIRGLTPGWGVRLEQRRAEQAVYTFSGELDLELPLTVEVGGVRSDAWTTILTRLDVERARMRARGAQPSSPNFLILR